MNKTIPSSKKIRIGIDAGISSLGISVIDIENNEIIDTLGVVIPQSSDSEANAKRREQRLKRKQIKRKASIPKKLLHSFPNQGLFPLTLDKMMRCQRRAHIKHQTGDPHYQDQAAYQAFMTEKPYALRKKALEGKPLTRIEMGRILWQFAQKRGFPEESRRNINNAEEAKAMTKGNINEGKIGIQQTEESIEKEKLPYLGYFLASLQPKHGNKKENIKGDSCVVEERIRKRYTYRYMYVDELNAIWKQQQSNPALQDFLTKENRQEVFNILFSQLPIQTPQRGQCTFECKKPRAHKASLTFEKYRAYKFLNNLRINHIKLSKEERVKAFKYLHKKEFTIAGLKKNLGKAEYESNYDFEGNKKIPSMPVTCDLQKLFDKKAWENLTPEEQRIRWHLLFEEKRVTRRQKKSIQKKVIPCIEKYGPKKWGWKEKELDYFSKMKFPIGTTHLSEKAMQYMLPYLKKGYNESDAAIAGSIPKAFGHTLAPSNKKQGEKPNYWQDLSAQDQNKIINHCLGIIKGDDLPDTMKTPPKTIYRRVIDYLKYQYPDKAYATENIYHPNKMLNNTEFQKKLPPPPKNIKQPTVRNFLKVLQGCLNYLIEKHNLNQPEIWIEMARDLKKSKKQIDKIVFEQNKNRAQNSRAYEELLRQGENPSPRNRKKYLLWKEAKFQCPYTGDSISFEKLFKQKKYDIEHIVPRYPKDNRMINLTLCRTDKNKEKDNQTPFEAFGHDPLTWDQMSQRAQYILPYRKYKRFIAEERPKEDLLQGDADLTGYITKASATYLRHITPHIRFSKGQITAMFRKMWSLDSLLSPRLKMPSKSSTKNVDLIPKSSATSHQESPQPYLPGRYFIAVQYDSQGDDLINYQVIGYAHFAANTLQEEPELYGNSQKIYKVEDQLRALNKEKERPDNAKINALEEELMKLLEKDRKIDKIFLKNQKKEDNAQKELSKLLKKAKIPESRYFILKGHLDITETSEDDINPFFIPENQKNRLDHRHHVLDAIVIASANLGDLQKIQKESLNYDAFKTKKNKLPFPWKTFRKDVKKQLEKTLITLHKKNKLVGSRKNPYPKGQLHEETYYGKRLSSTKESTYVHRVRLEDLINSQGKKLSFEQAYKRVDKIMDPVIRERIVLPALRRAQAEQFISKKEKYKSEEEVVKATIQGNPFFEEKFIPEGNRKILIKKIPKLFLPSKDNRKKIPILKVRIKEVGNTMVPLSKKRNSGGDPYVNRYVKPGNNYCIAYYHHIPKKGKEKWDFQTVTFWDAVKANQEKRPIIPRYDSKQNPLAFSIYHGDFVLLNFPLQGAEPNEIDPAILSRYLYRVQNIPQSGQLLFLKHTTTSDKNALDKIKLHPNPLKEAKPIKVILNPDGTVQRCFLPLF